VFVFRLSFLALKRYPKNAWLQMRQCEVPRRRKKYDFRGRGRRNPYDVARIASVAVPKASRAENIAVNKPI